jgi:hypothetical protein
MGKTKTRGRYTIGFNESQHQILERGALTEKPFAL